MLSFCVIHKAQATDGLSLGWRWCEFRARCCRSQEVAGPISAAAPTRGRSSGPHRRKFSAGYFCFWTVSFVGWIPPLDRCASLRKASASGPPSSALFGRIALRGPAANRGMKPILGERAGVWRKIRRQAGRDFDCAAQELRCGSFERLSSIGLSMNTTQFCSRVKVGDE